MTKHGIVNDTFLAECTIGRHKVCTIKNFEAISDELILDQISIMSKPHKFHFLE